MKPAKTLPLLLVPTVVLFLSSCSDNPVAHSDADEELTATLQLSEDHVHTLEEVVLTASVEDHHGDPFTDLEQVAFEYRLTGEADWRSRTMDLVGGAFTYTQMFFTSGQYELRVMGMHHGRENMEMLYQSTDHLDVGRAHSVVAGYRVEFEAFPGHIHEGETSTMRFWIMEDTNDRPPVGGLTAEVHCSDPSGTEESHHAVESSPGIYEASHTFQEAGETHIAIHFQGGTGQLEADFHFPISHGH